MMNYFQISKSLCINYCNLLQALINDFVGFTILQNQPLVNCVKFQNEMKLDSKTFLYLSLSLMSGFEKSGVKAYFLVKILKSLWLKCWLPVSFKLISDWLSHHLSIVGKRWGKGPNFGRKIRKITQNSEKKIQKIYKNTKTPENLEKFEKY